MYRSLIALLLGLAAAAASADDAADCRAGAGTFMTGVVVAPPKFAHGRFRKGIELSHTHLKLREDRSGRVYDVAVDNVFSPGYDRNKATIPPPLNTVRVNDRLEVCGAPYTRGTGIHWVHPNCGRRPTPDHPEGWIKRLAPDGRPGENLEGSTKFCPLF
jgi:hypothetical protein